VIKLIQDDRGATAIEYGLIAVLVALVAIIAFQLIGTNLFRIFDDIASQL
jgi:pilus assembly protein Flp/PilA